MSETSVEIGPWGPADSNRTRLNFLPKDLTKFTTISVGTDKNGIRSIQFFYDDKDSKPQHSILYGGTGGQIHNFDVDDEINGIQWIAGTYDETKQVTSLAFGAKGTNKVGKDGPLSFSLPIAKGKVIGFFGLYDRCINSLGVVIQPAA